MIGIDNEELTRYRCVWPFSVAQGARQMGYQEVTELLHRLLDKEEMPLQLKFGPRQAPVRVIEALNRLSLCDLPSLPPLFRPCITFVITPVKGFKVDQVWMRSGSRSNLEKRFKEEVGETIHAMIHAEKLEKARSLPISTTLSINEISQMCGYPSLHL